MRNQVWAPLKGSQELFLSCPHYEVLYEGTRGPGKTDALVMDFAQHVGMGFGQHWRGILFRQSYKQLADVIAKTERWFYQIWPKARFNSSDCRWDFPTGEKLFLRYMDKPAHYWNYHGHEYPWVGWEELTNWPNIDCYDSMKSCSRSSHPGMPRKYRSTANAYGKGHNWVKAYFIDPAPPGVPVVDRMNLTRVRIHGTIWENKYLLEADPEYVQRLQAIKDPNRRRAWLEGDWDIVAGGMFDDVWDSRVHVLKPFEIPPSWYMDRSLDWGAARPFSVGIWAESDGTMAPNGKLYPRGTLFRVAEYYGCKEEEPNVGVGLDPATVARELERKIGEWGWRGRVKPGPADNQIFSRDGRQRTIADEMKPLLWKSANQSSGSRAAGWTLMRARMLASVENKEEPQFYVFDRCRDFIRTIPALIRDENNPDDVDTETEDHIGDECRYRVTYKRPHISVQRI